ncbi:MAG: hypothetical protein PUP92_23885 [Rhizonema sp. PD38]|nr:hypothetical protein [Rhizonema sp. PD38]
MLTADRSSISRPFMAIAVPLQSGADVQRTAVTTEFLGSVETT